MNEMDILDFFYDALRAEGQTRETLFISLDDDVATKLSKKLKSNISLEALHRYADICIANEWLERTTVDPEYRYLSLTDAGLKMAMAHYYQQRGVSS